MKPLKLVIIEDEKAHFILMKQAIINVFPDISIYHFQRGGAFLEKFNVIDPDIIITECILPDMDGVELLGILDEKGSDIPVIMITGGGNKKVAVKAMKQEAWDYLKESLRKSENRFRDLADGISDWIWEIDAQGGYTYSNSRGEKVSGYPLDEIIGKKFYDFFSEERRVVLKNRFLQAMQAKKPVLDFENRIDQKNGNSLILETNAVPFFDKAGNLLGYRGLHRNISKRVQMETALRESEEKFRKIFEESPIGIALFNPKCQLVDANRSCLNIFGIANLADVIGLRLFDNPNVPDRVKTQLIRGETVNYETPYNFEKIKKQDLYKTKKSGTIFLEVNVSTRWLSLNKKNSFNGYLVQLQDISKRKKAEKRIKKLSRQLVKTQEMERQRLAFNLHDNMAQDLSTLKISIDTLLMDQPDASVKTRETVSKLSQMTNRIIMNVREMAYDLRPVDLDRLGLVKTVIRCCEEFSEEHNIEVDFFSGGMDEIKLDFNTEIILFRLIREALNNIKKHAQATRVVIRLVVSFPDIILRIEDNGIGFNVINRIDSAFNEKRMGLLSMKERVAHLNGKMSLKSRPMGGTKIVIEIPFEEENIGQKENSLNYR